MEPFFYWTTWLDLEEKRQKLTKNKALNQNPNTQSPPRPRKGNTLNYRYRNDSKGTERKFLLELSITQSLLFIKQ